MSELVKIDDLSIEIRRSARRKHLDLTVERDGRIVAAVPEAMGSQAIEQVLREKQPWMYSALAKKEETTKGPPAKEYVTGEGFHHLGRKYRLRLVHDGVPPAPGTVDLQGGRFLLRREDSKNGHAIFVAWYTARAAEWLAKRITALKARVGVEPGEIDIRDLGFRWASCTVKGKLFFHWRAVLLPPERIDYLVMHELVHIHEHNHSPAFYERLRRAVPDHKVHEAWFRKHGDEYRL